MRCDRAAVCDGISEHFVIGAYTIRSGATSASSFRAGIMTLKNCLLSGPVPGGSFPNLFCSASVDWS